MVAGETLLPHNASVMSSTRRTETPARYIFDERLLHAALPAAIPLNDGSLEGHALEPRHVERDVAGGRGEKTRLALATLVTSRANVLLLDEPTNNLDPASRDEILKAIAKYEGAIVLVTHDEGAVQALNPERVLLMPDGDEDLWNDSYLELVAEE